MLKNKIVLIGFLICLSIVQITELKAVASPPLLKGKTYLETVQYLARNKKLDLEIPIGLFGFSEFIEIWENANQYQEKAEKLLADKTLSDKEKLTIGYSMQKLPFDNYLAFCNRLVDLRVSNLLEQKLFEELLFTSYDWNTTLAEKYNHPKVRTLLLRLKSLHLFPKSAKGFDEIYIDEMLSGKTAKYVKEFREAGQIR